MTKLIKLAYGRRRAKQDEEEKQQQPEAEKAAIAVHIEHHARPEAKDECKTKLSKIFILSDHGAVERCVLQPHTDTTKATKQLEVQEGPIASPKSDVIQMANLNTATPVSGTRKHSEERTVLDSFVHSLTTCTGVSTLFPASDELCKVLGDDTLARLNDTVDASIHLSPASSESPQKPAEADRSASPNGSKKSKKKSKEAERKPPIPTIISFKPDPRTEGKDGLLPAGDGKGVPRSDSFGLYLDTFDSSDGLLAHVRIFSQPVDLWGDNESFSTPSISSTITTRNSHELA